ncbi:MAG TPA: monofunctional biosynthetic peptidoglycan transglycosylase [Thermohalobaculum sp.]|nr:monofunctional biosynthetic peptidoglycan transglycosylase [Thermohalobaculum sp.]
MRARDELAAEDPAGQTAEDGAPRRRGFVRRLSGFAVRLVLWFVLISLGWIGLYRFVDPPIWTHLVAEEARLGRVERAWRDLGAISPHLVRAVMAAEDARFCEHDGIDWQATRAALDQTLSGKRLIGGSTITQQTAKNVFLWHGRSWPRKGLEAGFALGMEALWPKPRIMEVYLNVAEFDTGAFGAEAAAQRYFGKPAAALTLPEAALLAAVLPAPRDRSASAPGRATRSRAGAIANGARTLEASGRDTCVLD